MPAVSMTRPPRVARATGYVDATVGPRVFALILRFGEREVAKALGVNRNTAVRIADQRTVRKASILMARNRIDAAEAALQGKLLGQTTG